MARPTLEKRLANLEAEVARLKDLLQCGPKLTRDWLDVVCGSFADDATAHEEAMRLGRKWRDSFRPKSAKRRKHSDGRTRHGSPKSAGENE